VHANVHAHAHAHAHAHIHVIKAFYIKYALRARAYARTFT
jgi:hypothetical protein